MSSFIDLTESTYNNLSQFGVLGGTTITTSAYTPILNNGYYGTTNTTYIPIAPGTFNPPGSPRPLPEINTAQSGLDQLIIDINNLTLPVVPLLADYTNQSIILQGGKKYTSVGLCAFTTSTITFDNQGDPNAQFFIIAPNTGYLSFTGVSFVLNGVSPCNIFWLADSYVSATFTDATTSPMYGNFISGTSSTFSYPSTITGHIYSKTAVTITPQTSVNVTTINTSTCSITPIPPTPVVCYLKGTLILTKQGFVPIEHIKAGHKVVTKGKIYKNKYVKGDASLQTEPVLWASKFKVINLNSKSRPICITKDALGNNYPFKDLYVSPGHSLLLNGRMVLAKNIVNGTTIYQDKECDDVEYYHLECDSHSAIFANGVLSESYLDVNNRDVFENSIQPHRKFNLKKIYALK